MIGIAPLKGDRGFPGLPGQDVCNVSVCEYVKQCDKCSLSHFLFRSQGLPGPSGPTGPPGERGYQGPKVSKNHSENLYH